MTAQQHIKEIKWLHEVLTNSPSTLNKTGEKGSITSPESSAPILTPYNTAVKKLLKQEDEDYQSYANHVNSITKKHNMSPETSIVIGLNQKGNIDLTNLINNGTAEQLVNKVVDFLSSNNIKSAVIPPTEKSPVPALVIDLAQKDLLTNLQNIYDKETLPALIKKGKSPIINPDGKEVTPKEIVVKEISQQLLAIRKRAANVGIGSNEMDNIIRGSKTKFEANQKG
ncbi:MAG: hypothetical protein R3D71_07510 [Rickettsiales bacterium]